MLALLKPSPRSSSTCALQGLILLFSSRGKMLMGNKVQKWLQARTNGSLLRSLRAEIRFATAPDQVPRLSAHMVQAGTELSLCVKISI